MARSLPTRRLHITPEREVVLRAALKLAIAALDGKSQLVAQQMLATLDLPRARQHKGIDPVR